MKKIKKSLFTLFVGTSLATSIMLTSCGSKGFTYEFNVNGGENQEKEFIEEGKEFELPTPKKEGYTFLGWYDNPEFNGEKITTITASKNMTFYAKWAKLGVLNFDLNGATLNKSVLNVAIGDNLNDVLKDYIPVKNDLKFAGWYIYNTVSSKYTLVSDDAVMPEEGLTVTARFKQKCVVEFYVKNSTTGNYELKESSESYELIGDTFTSSHIEDGYSEVNTPNTVSSVKVSENASDNVLKKYYAKDVYEIHFDSNYPVEMDAVTSNLTLENGDRIKFPKLSDVEGYELVGWSTSKNGEVKYDTNKILENLFNDQDSSFEPKYYASGSETLYAVWKKGSTDMFGGADEIYYLDEKSNDIYLKRDGIYFKGVINDSSFIFFDNNKKIILEGKLLNNGKFSYLDSERQDSVYGLYNKGMNENVNLYFGQYDDLSYVTKDENGVLHSSKGTFIILDDGTYSVTFTDGDLKGTVMNFVIGKYQGQNAFQVRNEEDVNLGSMKVYQLADYDLVDSGLTLTLNGYGTAALNSSNYYYNRNEDSISLYGSSGQSVGTLKFEEINNEKCLVLYNSTYDVVINDDNKSLTIDGLSFATVKDGDVVISGHYYIESSILGDYLVTIKDSNNVLHKYLVYTVTSDSVDGAEAVSTTLFKEVSILYKEYYYQNGSSIYYAPLLVIDGKTTATLYGFVSKGVFVKVSSGTYNLNNDGTYTYTVTNVYDEASKALTSPYDLSTISSFVYSLDETNSYNVSYWYTYSTSDGEVNLVLEYNFTDSDTKTLKFISHKVIYFDGANTYEGTFSTTGEITTLTFDDFVLYVLLDNELSTATECQLPKTEYLYTNGSINKNEYFSYDKFGNVTYNVVVEENNESKVKIYEGSLVETENSTICGDTIYEFKYLLDGSSTTLEFIKFLANNGSTYYAKRSESYSGDFTVSNNRNLKFTLDGFDYKVKFTIADEVIETLYYVDDENNTISIYMQSYTITFDVTDKENGKCRMRGLEAGSYLVMNNQTVEYYVTLDGYGKAVVSKNVNGSIIVVDENATYTSTTTITSSGSYNYKLEFIDNNQTIIYYGTLFTYTINNQKYNAFIVSHSEINTKFVNESDMSVLELDQFGNATLYKNDGSKETGTCKLITYDLLYYVNNANSDACVYTYDIESGTIVKGDFDLYGYYTKDFESLVFYQYGFALVNGSDRYFYNIVDGAVVLYEYDPTNTDANEYGFVEIKFGSYENQVTFKGKTYYENTGYAISFNRVQSNSEKYPLKSTSTVKDANGVEKTQTTYYYLEDLTYAPTGETFSVNGVVKVLMVVVDQDGNEVSSTENSYTCSVVREKLEDAFDMYVLFKGYKFGINAEYQGMNENDESISTYEVTSLSYTIDLQNDTYLQMAYFYYVYFRMDISSTMTDPYGGLVVVTSYDENGDVLENYCDSAFTEKANLVDSNGNVLNLEHAKYTMSSSGNYLYIYASVVGSDNYTYRLYMVVTNYNAPKSALGVRVLYMTRVQTLTYIDYELTIEQVVTYNGNNTIDKAGVGQLASLSLKQNGEDVQIETIIRSANGIYYGISREYDENGIITSSQYYKFNLKQSSNVEDNRAQVFESVDIELVPVTTYYSSDKSSYVDIDNDGNVLLIKNGDSYVNFSNMEYDSETDTYSYDVITSEGTEKYTLKIVDGKVVISLVETKTSTKE